MSETFTEEVERRREERETQPDDCSHCRFATTELTNYSRHYGGNVGAHWLCEFCEHTVSASRLGAGGHSSYDVADVAAMLNVLINHLRGRAVAPHQEVAPDLSGRQISTTENEGI